MPEIAIRKPHLRRLRTVWQSAGWRCHDVIELELVATGLLERQVDSAGRETVRLSEMGVQALAASLQVNRSALDAHELLVERVAKAMCQAGRMTWRRLSLRANVEGAWTVCRPDVFSIRSTSVEAYAEPVVHEIKVRRADLLSDLRQPAKGAAYLDTAAQCWYVLAAGIARPDEIPPQYGVMVADSVGIEVVRPAPHRPMTVPFATWMALARCGSDRFERPEQGVLCAEEDGLDCADVAPVVQLPEPPPPSTSAVAVSAAVDTTTTVQAL